NFMIGHTQVVGPTLVNQLQFAFSRTSQANNSVWTVGYPDLGMRNIYSHPPTPQFYLSVSGAFGAFIDDFYGLERQVYTIADTVRWNTGRHEISMGFDYRKQDMIKDFQWLRDPYMAFDGIFSGYGVADFFLGLPSGLDQLAYGEIGNQYFPVYSAFVEDKIKVTP